MALHRLELETPIAADADLVLDKCTRKRVCLIDAMYRPLHTADNRPPWEAAIRDRHKLAGRKGTGHCLAATCLSVASPASMTSRLTE